LTESQSSVETSSEISLKAKKAAHRSWANTRDWSARTAPARRAHDAKFLAEADGDPKRAEALRKAYFADLTLKSVQARKRRAAVRERIAEMNCATALHSFSQDGGGDDAAA
jgi:hypothetical protein